MSLVLFSVSVWALWLVGVTERFYLTTIPVEGSKSIPVSEIAAASGLAGRHIFSADPNEAAGNIAKVPGIISATVDLKWPNEVNIKVVEDKPLAIWEQANEQFWVLEHGQLIRSRSEGPGLLNIISESPDQVGSNSFVPGNVLEAALQLRQLRPNIDQLYYKPAGGLSYQDGRGWRAYFGSGHDMEQKLVVYETIIEDLLERGIAPEYVSVSNKAKPFYRASNG